MLNSLNQPKVLNHLGITSKSCKLVGSKDEVLAEASAIFNRLTKWHLQTMAREILFTKALNCCCRTIMPLRNTVDIIRSKKDTYSYGGLMTCGSIWKCPVCASKISEKKRLELVSGINHLKQNGAGIMMLTVTTPHYHNDSVIKITDGINTALRNFFNHTTWKQFSLTYGISTKIPKTLYSYTDDPTSSIPVTYSKGFVTKRTVGRIRTLEVTFGKKNGWHPHFHILLFTESPVSADDRGQIEQDFFKDWKACCKSAGLGEPDQEHGLTLVDGTKTAKYISKWGTDEFEISSVQQTLIEKNNPKWGVENEMTKSHLKKGTASGHVKGVLTYTPFGLLHLYAGGDKSMGHRFAEYADCFHGRRQLVYSPGLRTLMDLDEKEKTDAEHAAETEKESMLFSSISSDVWKVILSKEKRGILLEVCRSGIEALEKYISELLENNLQPKTVKNKRIFPVMTIDPSSFIGPMPRNTCRSTPSLEVLNRIEELTDKQKRYRIFNADINERIIEAKKLSNSRRKNIYKSFVGPKQFKLVSDIEYYVEFEYIKKFGEILETYSDFSDEIVEKKKNSEWKTGWESRLIPNSDRVVDPDEDVSWSEFSL